MVYLNLNDFFNDSPPPTASTLHVMVTPSSSSCLCIKKKAKKKSSTSTTKLTGECFILLICDTSDSTRWIIVKDFDQFLQLREDIRGSLSTIKKCSHFQCCGPLRNTAKLADFPCKPKSSKCIEIISTYCGRRGNRAAAAFNRLVKRAEWMQHFLNDTILALRNSTEDCQNIVIAKEKMDLFLEFHTRRKTVANDILSALPSVMVNNQATAECSICVSQMHGEVKLLPCGHCFHENCIKEWFTVQQACPYCRNICSDSSRICVNQSSVSNPCVRKPIAVH